MNMGLWDQFQRPTGQLGKVIAARMNKEHYQLTSWGLSHVTIKPDNTVLDVGCGGGKTINRLAEMVPQGKVYGIDYSPDMVVFAKEVNKKFIENGKVEIYEASADNTGFTTGTFDLVTACETYYFWPNLPAAFKEINRVLKSKGHLLMINEMIKDDVYDVKDAEIIQKTHLHLFRLEEIKAMLQTAGFVTVDIFRKDGSPWNVVVATK
jgi:ubiquinone/menaquinone biosynthesis C-methylase UbiE